MMVVVFVKPKAEKIERKKIETTKIFFYYYIKKNNDNDDDDEDEDERMKIKHQIKIKKMIIKNN